MSLADDSSLIRATIGRLAVAGLARLESRLSGEPREAGRNGTLRTLTALRRRLATLCTHPVPAVQALRQGRINHTFLLGELRGQARNGPLEESVESLTKRISRAPYTAAALRGGRTHVGDGLDIGQGPVHGLAQMGRRDNEALGAVAEDVEELGVFPNEAGVGVVDVVGLFAAVRRGAPQIGREPGGIAGSILETLDANLAGALSVCSRGLWVGNPSVRNGQGVRAVLRMLGRF